MNGIISAIKSIRLGERKKITALIAAAVFGLLCSRVKLAADMMPFGCALIAAAYISRKNINYKGVVMGVLMSTVFAVGRAVAYASFYVRSAYLYFFCFKKE